MTLNPELRRNLWLQLSAHRLVAMPVVLGIVFGLVLVAMGGGLGTPRGSAGSALSLAGTAFYAFILLTFVWGSRRAAESIGEEVNGSTWDSQRMSSLGAWTMTWGKLVGSTVYPWYGAACCVAVYVAAYWVHGLVRTVILDVALMVVTALVAQTTALAAALAMWRKQEGRSNPRWAMAQGIGLLAGIAAASKSGLTKSVEEHALALYWYGTPIEAGPFWLASLALAFGWLLLCAYRLMRQELLYRTWPWAWVGFVLFAMAYVGGFAHGGTAWLWSFAGTALILFYVALFVEAKRFVRYRIFLVALGAGDWRRALAATPLWLPTYVIGALAAAIAVAAGGDGISILDLPEEAVLVVPRFASTLAAIAPVTVAAGLLFALRDAGLVLALNLSPRAGRADVTAFIYLALAYGPLVWLALAAGQRWLLAFLVPTFPGDPLLALGPVLLELVLVAIFLWRRWRRYAVPPTAGRAPATAAAAGVAE